MKQNQRFVLLFMAVLVLSAVAVLAVGVDVQSNEHCCLDYYNTTNHLCYSNSTQAADRDVSTTTLCGNLLGGMPSAGSQIGSFLTNMAPGIGTFVLVLGIFGGIVALIYGIVTAIQKRIGKN